MLEKSSSSSKKGKTPKSDLADKPLNVHLQMSIKEMKKQRAKGNQSEISNSENKTEDRKVLVPKQQNIAEMALKRNKKSSKEVTSELQCEGEENKESKTTKKTTKRKHTEIFKKSTEVGDVDLTPEGSPVEKKKAKKMKVEKSSGDVPCDKGNAQIERDAVEKAGDDTLSDHGDTNSSDDCEAESVDSTMPFGTTDDETNDESNDDDESDDDESDDDGESNDDDGNEFGFCMIDNEAEEGEFSEDEAEDRSDEGYGIVFEAGCRLKESKSSAGNVSDDSVKEELEMEADEDFVVSDTHVEYDNLDDSWLDDEPSTKTKKYSRIKKITNECSSSEDEHPNAQEDSGSDEEREITITARHEKKREEDGDTLPGAKRDQPMCFRDNCKEAKRGCVVNFATSGVSEPPAVTGPNNDSTSAPPERRAGQDQRAVRGDSSASQSGARRPLTIAQKLTILRRCNREDLLSLARELCISERQFDSCHSSE